MACHFGSRARHAICSKERNFVPHARHGCVLPLTDEVVAGLRWELQTGVLRGLRSEEPQPRGCQRDLTARKDTTSELCPSHTAEPQERKGWVTGDSLAFQLCVLTS